MEHITQNCYDRRNKLATIPTALAKDKEKKQEPIQKIQTRQPREQRKIPKNRHCGFYGQQIGHPNTIVRQKTVKCHNCQKIGSFAGVCRGKPNSNKSQINYLEDMTSEEEEESEPEEICRKPQINKILPDNNDHYVIEWKIYETKQKFTIDTGSPVTIMPNNPNLYKMENIKPIKERSQHVNKNKIKFLGKYGSTQKITEQNSNNLTNHQTK